MGGLSEIIMITKNQFQKIEQYVSSKLDSLNWYHTQEVRKIAQKLAHLEKADKDIVDVAVLFHDLGKIKTGDLGHAEVSAELARKFLEKENLERRFIEEVIYCIIAHELPWKNQSNLVNTIEAKVVFDADMIQQLSEFGIIKHTLVYQEIIKKDFREGMIRSRDQLFKAYNLILSDNGRKLAEEGYKLVKEFYKELL
jgi:putative nucleotidyltransferase with HDIG domain